MKGSAVVVADALVWAVFIIVCGVLFDRCDSRHFEREKIRLEQRP